MSSSLSPVSIALGAAAAGLSVIALTGCAAVQHLLQHEHEESFATYAEAQQDWIGVGVPAWIPADSTDLHNLATDDESQSVIRVTSASTPVGCSDADRQGLPALTADWAPQEWPNSVLSCGEYEVVPLDDGWLGWFNAAETGDTPG
jgi:hypothetical protein